VFQAFTLGGGAVGQRQGERFGGECPGEGGGEYLRRPPAPLGVQFEVQEHPRREVGGEQWRRHAAGVGGRPTGVVEHDRSRGGEGRVVGERAVILDAERGKQVGVEPPESEVLAVGPVGVGGGPAAVGLGL
jgi:hypothetical protein